MNFCPAKYDDQLAAKVAHSEGAERTLARWPTVLHAERGEQSGVQHGRRAATTASRWDGDAQSAQVAIE